MHRLAGLFDLGAPVSWLLTKVFSPLAPIFDFIGDHRWGVFALLLVVAAGAAWVYVPVIGRQTAKLLLVVAVAAGFYDGGYSHRAAIDREAWKQAEQVRRAAELAEYARRAAELTKARIAADAAEAALKSQMEEHAAYMRDIENASKAANNDPCLSGAGVVRLDGIGRRKKASPTRGPHRSAPGGA